MREYEVNTRVTTGGSHVFTLKGVSSYHRKEPFTKADLLDEVLAQTWPYRKYSVVMNAKPHNALSRRLAVEAAFSNKSEYARWEYRYSTWLQSYCINVRATGVDGVDKTVILDGLSSGATDIADLNTILNTTGINLTWFDWEVSDENV